MKYKYDHFGVPTKKKRKGMIHYPEFKVWCSSYEKDPYRIEWIFFEKNCKLPSLVKAVPHICFRVKDINKAIRGKKVIFGPVYYQGNWFAFINEDGVPIEFSQLSKKP